MWADGWTDMKLTVAFCNFTDVTKKVMFLQQINLCV
jgi:hypothetical protein